MNKVIKILEKVTTGLKKKRARKQTESARKSKAAKVAKRKATEKPADSVAHAQDGRDAASASMRKMRESVRNIGEIPQTRNQDVHEACRRDSELFLITYLPESFFLAFSPDHKKVIKKTETAIIHGGLFAEAMPRGGGKTTMIGGLAIWAIVYAWRRFLAIIGAEAQHAKIIMQDITKEFLTNDILYRDFPIECHAVRALEGISQRAGAQLYHGKPTGIKWSNDIAVFPNIEGSECRGSVIMPRGLTGAIRGMHHKTDEGEVLRPDFFLLDDPQTEDSAKSQTQCDQREKLITKAVLGLAGPKTKIAGVMPGTVIQKNDLIDRMLDHKLHPEFQGERMQLLYEWPKNKEIWLKDYAELRKEGLAKGDRGQAATDFYKANREKMDLGAVMAWVERFNEDELSALQHAMNLLIDLGEEAFMSEYQNDAQAAHTALYEIEPNMVARRLSHLPIRTCTKDAPFVVGMIDVNPAYGLSWVVGGFRNDMAGFVMDYGKHPEEETVPLVEKDLRGGVAQAQAIFAGLNTLVATLAAKVWIREDEGAAAIDLLLIDCGHEMATIGKFIAAAVGKFPFPVVGSRGRDAKKYTPTRPIGVPNNNLHLTQFALVPRVIVHSSDYWRVHAQKAFLLPSGAPCSISLYGTEAKAHAKFARHICAEMLVEFLKGDVADSYNWAMQPGEKNDLLDCLVGCCVGAAYAGADVNYNQLAAQSQAPAAQQQRKRPRFKRHEI